MLAFAIFSLVKKNDNSSFLKDLVFTMCFLFETSCYLRFQIGIWRFTHAFYTPNDMYCNSLYLVPPSLQIKLGCIHCACSEYSD